MLQQLRQLFAPFSHLTPVTILDIIIVAILLYQVLSILRGRRAAHIMNGILVLIAMYLIAIWFRLELLSSLLSSLAPYAPIALIVMFQSELRRMLARLGRRPWVSMGAQLQRRETTDEILLALQQLSHDNTGALIVLERDIGLRTFIESGVLLDANVSRDLLLSVFQSGGTLHDGAAIVQGDRIAAAACFLPLSTNPAIMRKLGTRHRAAIGVTEETDCLALVVSEESGRISIASGGDIELDVTIERAEQRIRQHFGRRKKRHFPARPLPPVEFPSPESETISHAGADLKQANRS